MTIPRGTKTASASAVAVTALGTAFFDPTGISLLAFLGASAATVVGTTYHAAKGVSNSMKEARCRKAEEQAQALRMTPEQHLHFQCQVEDIIRRFTASIEGCLVQGILFIGLPYMGVILAIETAQVGAQFKCLKMLADRAGGKTALIRTISKRNVAVQVIGGAAIKTATIAVTLGHDFDAAMKGIGGLIDDVDFKEVLAEAGNSHEGLLETPIIKETTELVDQPQEAMKRFLYDLDGDNLDGQPNKWTWKGRNPVEYVIALGAVVAAVSKGVDVVLDKPLHKGMERVVGSKVR
ncbi:hypothetical protein LZ30DRAFT_770100 [Colletotrichum cereale]|nr:hypothetical protein LZ30DRAFT_770100 [Colletotrichum cereale]